MDRSQCPTYVPQYLLATAEEAKLWRTEPKATVVCGVEWEGAVRKCWLGFCVF